MKPLVDGAISTTRANVWVGTAGWSIPKAWSAAFPEGGSHLERYAQVFNTVEINSSFYRPHRRTTYERWASSVPAHFRFAVKCPRSVTHECRLIDVEDRLAAFFEEIGGLGRKLGVVLAQLPPTLAFEERSARTFLLALGGLGCDIVCEPRHPSWFTDEVSDLLASHKVARVLADPPVHHTGSTAGGWSGTLYMRLHGSPEIYRSPYSAADRQRFARIAARAGADQVWCIFDNTALGEATGDALAMTAELLPADAAGLDARPA